jgi:hypothetical protein
MPAVHASCLCGDVAWEVAGRLEFMSHCHCVRCRKAHGAAFATAALCQPDAFRLLRGRERIGGFESSPGIRRPFCTRCGSVVADGEPSGGAVVVPAGPFDDDPGVRPVAHIFVGSKAPWFELAGALPRFDAFPPGFDGSALPDLPPRDRPSAGVRGSCLCGGVGWVAEGAPTRCMHCHCARCRKARGAAHASNLFMPAAGVRFTRGEDLLASYKVPDARFFTQVFCRVCGSPTPRVDPGRGVAILPMGSLDDDPPMRPEGHIFVGSMAPWYAIADALPRHEEYPPAT